MERGRQGCASDLSRDKIATPEVTFPNSGAGRFDINERDKRVSNPLNNVEAITVFSDDVPASREFYTTVFAAPILFEDEVSVALRIGAIVINVLARTEAPALVAPAPVAESGAAASVMLTVNVADVDVVCSALRERGVDLVNGPIDRPWGRRTAVFLDPSGLPWEIAQELG